MTGEKKVEIRRGLRDVYIDRTHSSFIDGKEGKLLYRGFNINDLAQNSSFEETAYLLLNGELPNSSQLAEFDGKLRANRQVSSDLLEIIRLTVSAHPMDVLRTAISASSGPDAEASDISTEATIRKGIALTAMVPTVVAAHARIVQGKEPVAPRSDLSHAANFLYMLFGEEPDPQDAAIIDKDFVLHAEHGINASSFAARIAASTKADVHCAVTAGIAVLKGPSHGGAAEGVMKMALEIGSEDKAHQYVADRLKNKDVIVGFGHRVYRTEDPRAKHLKEDAKRLSERRGDPKWFGILTAVVDAMAPYARRGIAQNVDLWSGAIYQILGIPESLYIPIFAMGRIPGWTAQVVEQLENNILLRPRLLYVGEMDRVYVPLDQR
jgi:citrate synthase